MSNIPWDALPNSFVVKSNLDSNSSAVLPLINGISAFDGREYSSNEIIEFFQPLLDDNDRGRMIIFEEFINPDRGQAADDFKCHVFNGKVKFIETIRRHEKSSRWYTPDWTPLEQQMVLLYPFDDSLMEINPRTLSKLISDAETLGRAYGPHYVRIDFFLTDNGTPVLGELTHFPNEGVLYRKKANHILGELWEETGCID